MMAVTNSTRLPEVNSTGWPENHSVSWDSPAEGEGGGGIGVTNIVIGTILYILVAMTVTGNAMVLLAVARNKRLQTVFNMYIVNLAVTDILVALLAMSFYTTENMLGYWPFGEFMCGVWIFFDYGMTFASVFTLIAISVDRFWAVKWSMHYRSNKTKKKTFLGIALTWVCMLVLWLPPCITDRLANSRPGECIWEPSNNKEFVVVVAVIGHHGSCFSILFCYVSVLVLLRHRAKVGIFTVKKTDAVTVAEASSFHPPVKGPSTRAVPETSITVDLATEARDCGRGQGHRGVPHVGPWPATANGLLAVQPAPNKHRSEAEPATTNGHLTEHAGLSKHHTDAVGTKTTALTPDDSASTDTDLYNGSTAVQLDTQLSRVNGPKSEKTDIVMQPSSKDSEDISQRNTSKYNDSVETGETQQESKFTHNNERTPATDSHAKGQAELNGTQREHETVSSSTEKQTPNTDGKEGMSTNLNLKVNGEAESVSKRPQNNEISPTDETKAAPISSKGNNEITLHDDIKDVPKSPKSNNEVTFKRSEFTEVTLKTPDEQPPKTLGKKTKKEGGSKDKQEGKFGSKEMKAFVTLSYIVISYLVCWVPFHVVFDVSAVRPDLVPDIVFTVTFWMTYLNSTINPILYNFSSKDFRNAFRDMCKR
ncbi:hypothetical protein V1264_020964 [Littorina saxatilis]|uniref:G-protein coupled receptors family 1 profile domain-containing protein n=1 Tax=Littorina saxatilis TaxID=31220 RepID=A0AAN9GDG3_9CAEN